MIADDISFYGTRINTDYADTLLIGINRSVEICEIRVLNKNQEVRKMGIQDRRIAFIGGGHITEIIVSNLVKTQRVLPRNLIVSDPIKGKVERLESNYGISVAGDNLEAVASCDFIFINVLPHMVGEVVAEFRQVKFPPDKVIISVAAGIPMKTYAVLGEQVAVVRALPNPPSQIGLGIAALAFNPHVQDTLRQDIFELFAALGEYVVVREEYVNIVMALSSPAITYMLFQAMIDAGVRAGIDRETSTKIVAQTISGSMAVWKARQIPPYELISEAATPGGISVESLFTLETYAFKAAVMDAIDSAIQRADELSRSVE
jgi:pyrroline-5-carboxylate reductase